MHKNNYNHIAPVYDLLSFMVFGNTLSSAQKYFLSSIPSGASILLMGDGSGKSLQYILTHSACKKIIYVDASSEMIAIARKRIKGIKHKTEVIFEERKIEEFSLTSETDAIVTPFLFDLFTEEKSRALINKYSSLLKNNGVWIFTDFRVNESSLHKYWQRVLLQLMYSFFSVVSGTETDKLPDFEKCFNSAGLSKKVIRRYYKGMIETAVYAKQDETRKS